VRGISVVTGAEGGINPHAAGRRVRS